MNIPTSSTATGTLGAHTTTFPILCREYNDTPPAMTATVSFPVSIEDIVAAVWWLVRESAVDQVSQISLTDPDDCFYLPTLVLETLVNDGNGVTDALVQITHAIRPGSDEHAMVGEIRALVTRFYSPASTAAGVPARSGRSRQARRQPATAGVAR